MGNKYRSSIIKCVHIIRKQQSCENILKSLKFSINNLFPILNGCHVKFRNVTFDINLSQNMIKRSKEVCESMVSCFYLDLRF